MSWNVISLRKTATIHLICNLLKVFHSLMEWNSLDWCEIDFSNGIWFSKSHSRLSSHQEFYETRKISIFKATAALPSTENASFITFLNVMSEIYDNCFDIISNSATFADCGWEEKRFTWFATAIKLNFYCKNAYDYCRSYDGLLGTVSAKGHFMNF